MSQDRIQDEPAGTNEPLQDAIVALLRRIPERWAEYDSDDLTTLEEQALHQLVKAGMVEWRGRVRVRTHNHPTAVEATLIVTGPCGLNDAMDPVVASMWGDWGDAYLAWKTGETRDAPFIIPEHLKPAEWRLTEQGVLTRVVLDKGQTGQVLDLVFCRGAFSQLKPFHGYGKLVKMRKVQADATLTPTVNIGNWPEGADVIATAFEAKARQEESAAEKTADTAKAECSHSPDFSSVVWFGTRHSFAKGNQACVVGALWEAWESGKHSLSIETLVDKAGSNDKRFQLAKVFRRKREDGEGYVKHPALGTMIQGDTKGCYRLVAPDESR